VSILDGELAELIYDALEGADVPYGLTLIRSVPGSTAPPYSAHNPGSATTQTFGCRGFIDDYRADQRDGTIIQVNDRKVIVLAPSLSVTPAPQDKITARGTQYVVVSVRADPAMATWTIQARSS